LLRPAQAVPARGWAPAPARSYAWLSLLAGVALRDAVRRLAEVDAVLKWPNDLLLRRAGGEAKCAGLLAEAVTGAGGSPAVVLGLGLNVTTRAGELPPTTGAPATSLALGGAAATDRDSLLRALLRGLADWYGRWRDAAGDATACGLVDAYREGCATIGRQVRVLLPGASDAAAADAAVVGEATAVDAAVVGEATAVDADGQLVVRTADGERRVSAGDVLHVR
jgi:BirA family biotin operon repressor/biotin-[acetyl-CoA-carboxylase] ligase